MKQRIELNVEARTTGRKNSRGLRNNSMVPGIVYGSVENANVSVHVNDILKYNSRAYENALLNLKSTDSKINGKIALIKSVQVNPLSRRPEHVDFFALDMSKTVRVSIEISIEGKAIGLAEGGLLNVVTRQVEIECLPTAIPESIKVDVSNLGLGDSIHASDLTIPDGVKLISRPELTIAAVVIQEEEAVATPVVAAAAATPAAGAPAAAAAAGAKPAAGAKAAAPAAAAGAKPAAGKK